MLQHNHPAVQQAIANCLAHGAQTEHEKVIVLAKDGRTVFEKAGNELDVTFVGMDTVRALLFGDTIVHNHPPKYPSSLSDADLKSAFNMQCGIYACCADGGLYWSEGLQRGSKDDMVFDQLSTGFEYYTNSLMQTVGKDELKKDNPYSNRLEMATGHLFMLASLRTGLLKDYGFILGSEMQQALKDATAFMPPIIKNLLELYKEADPCQCSKSV